jgi:hypothetical protein
MRKITLQLASQSFVVFFCTVSFCVAILLSLVGLAAAQAPRREQAALTLKSALAQFFKDHDSAKVRAGLLAASNLDPTYALPFYELGIVAESQSDWPAATQWFTKFRQLEASSEYSQRAAQELDRLERIAELRKTPEGHSQWSYDEAMMHGEVLLRLGFLKEAGPRPCRAFCVIREFKRRSISTRKAMAMKHGRRRAHSSRNWVLRRR